MKNCKGFSLLELLVAATIVSALAVLATVSYQNSVMETRIQAAKSRTEVLAGAVQRFRLDRGAGQLGSGLVFSRATGSCNPSSSSVASLILCGYVDNDGGWSDPYVQYYVCNGQKTASTPCARTDLAAPLACMTGKNVDKLPAKYKTNYAYCVSEIGTDEKTGS